MLPSREPTTRRLPENANPCTSPKPSAITTSPEAKSQYLDVVPVAEGPLNLTLGALARSDAALKPSVRHFLAHLHRAAHHLTRGTPPR